MRTISHGSNDRHERNRMTGTVIIIITVLAFLSVSSPFVYVRRKLIVEVVLRELLRSKKQRIKTRKECFQVRKKKECGTDRFL